MQFCVASKYFPLVTLLERWQKEYPASSCTSETEGLSRTGANPGKSPATLSLTVLSARHRQPEVTHEQKVSLRQEWTLTAVFWQSLFDSFETRHLFDGDKWQSSSSTVTSSCPATVIRCHQWYSIPDSQHKGRNTPSMRSPVVYEERMRPGHWLESVLCVSFSALTLLVGCHLSSKTLFQNNWRKKTGNN